MPDDQNPVSESTEVDLTQTGSEDQQESLPGGEEITFYNPTDVPDALRPTFLEMKKGLTQATQEVSKIRKGLEAQQRETQASAYKAQLLDTLLADTRVQGVLNSIRNGELPEESTLSEDMESIDPQFKKVLSTEVAPLKKQLEELRSQQLIERERVAFLQARQEEQKLMYPTDTPAFDPSPYLEGMYALWEKTPQLDMESAFRIVRDQQTQQALRSARKKTQAGKSSVEATSGTSPVRKATRPASNMREAAEEAIQQLGLSRREIFPD